MQRHQNALDSRLSQGVDYWGLIVVDMTYVHLISCYDD
jgi:hypothetical protein